MSRVKGGLMAQKRRRNILEQVKGYRFGRSKKKRQAVEAIHHAQNYSFAHRKDKKADFRSLWIVRINAVLKNQGMQYSRFIKGMKEKGFAVDRKILAAMAKDRPEAFQRIVDQVK
jgi:large subunit ribosomal protein L20